MSRKPVVKNSANKGGGKLRIIGGEWRSRQLPVVDLPGLRPTTDRVRETLFNWVQNDIPGARCLDLFAGSGALGFEAASRGAASVTMIELQNNAMEVLKSNKQLLSSDNGDAPNRAENIELIQQNALSWLAAYQGNPFDVVFLDPPFDSDYLKKAIKLLDEQACLSANACIYLECANHQHLPDLPVGWALSREKKAGQLKYFLARYNADG
jgi:16S rRNA (guanine966-N2)-methyltransferase